MTLATGILHREAYSLCNLRWDSTPGHFACRLTFGMLYPMAITMTLYPEAQF